MFLHIAAKIRQRREIHLLAYLRQRQIAVFQVVGYHRHGLSVYQIRYAAPRVVFDCLRKVLCRYIQLFGIVRHFAIAFAASCREQRQQAADDVRRAFRSCHAVVELGVKLEQVVHHRQRQTAHQLVVEKVMRVVLPFADAVDIGQKPHGIIRRKRHHGILEQTDTSAHAVVVGRQQVVDKFGLYGDELHTNISRLNLAHQFGVRYHGNLVAPDIGNTVIVAERAAARKTYQVDNPPVEAFGVYLGKRFRKYDFCICFLAHTAKIGCFMQIWCKYSTKVKNYPKLVKAKHRSKALSLHLQR